MKTIRTWPRWPEADQGTLAKLQEVLDSGRWAISGPFMGQETMEQRFARAFADYNGAPHCVTLDHGTSALIAALEALDIGYGDEVIVPGFTWVAPALAVLSVNAIPVIADIEPDTFCISPQSIRQKLSVRTKAIIPVHMYGCMADMDAIMAIAAERGLAVVEDTAHSHGSVYKGRYAGTIGHIGVFSMQQGKVLTCGEGGAALTHDAALKERIEQSAWNARTLLDPQATPVGAMQLVTGRSRFATNRCISEFQAAILLDQLGKLDAQNAKRERHARWLDEQLAAIPGVLTMRRRPGVERQTYYGYVVRIDAERFGLSAGEAIARLKVLLNMEDFMLHPPYIPLHRNPLYAPHPRVHELELFYREALQTGDLELPYCDEAHATGIVFHHSMLLAEQEDLADIVQAFRSLSARKSSP